MTAPATTRRAGPFNGNGTATSFPFSFKVFAASDIAVTRTSVAGIDTTLVLGTDYSVTLNADQDDNPGGSITYPITGTALAVGEKLTAVGAIPYDQTADLPTGGNYRAQVVENALDRGVMQVQQLAEEISRALTLPVSAAGADTELPAPEGGKVIAWNAAGTALVNVDSSDLASVVVAGTAYTDVFSGTGAQTQFVLTADPGGVNALDVAISGVSQVNGVDFTVSGTTLTFTTAPPAGTGNVAVRYVAALPVSTVNAQDVVYNPLTSYATGAGAALNGLGRVPVGVDNTGATVCTSALRAVFDYCIPRGLAVVLSGSYLVDGLLADPGVLAAGSLHIHCVGDVTITVSPSAAVFDEPLISCYTSQINSGFLTGGRLTLNLNNRGSTGLLVRHTGGDGGTVKLGPLTVRNCTKPTGNTNENAGVVIYGRYLDVQTAGTIVDGVTRSSAGGACKGISISDVVGTVTLVAPQASRVLCGPGTGDADGISVFGRDISGTYATRGGSLTIINPLITDCQGRSIKTQISQSTIIQPVVERRNVVAFATSDIDHQVGGVHEIVGFSFTYRKASGVSPVPTTFIPISLQHQCTDRPGRMRVVGGTLRTESAIERFCFVTVAAAALVGEVEVADVEVQTMAGLTAPITRSVLEFDGTNVQASGGLHVSIRGLRGDFSATPLLGYTGSSANMSKLSFDIQGNENTGADGASGAAGKVFGNLSGDVITQVGGFRLSNNAGFYDFLGAWNFNYLTLKAGCTFSYDRAASTVTNGPTMTGSYPRVEALGSLSNGSRDIRVMEDTGAALVIHFRQAAAWRSVS